MGVGEGVGLAVTVGVGVGVGLAVTVGEGVGAGEQGPLTPQDVAV